jgi:hypothetical protein
MKSSIGYSGGATAAGPSGLFDDVQAFDSRTIANPAIAIGLE